MGRGSSRGFSPRFFLPPVTVGNERPIAPGARLTLESDDSHHAARVLRLRTGDLCEVVAPDGRVFEATVSSEREPVDLILGEPLSGAAAGAVFRHRVGLVQALARPSVMDYLLEKGTEVGADFFLLVASAGSPAHAEPGIDRLERWRRVTREAAKQSKQTRVPWVEFAASPTEAVRVMQERDHACIALEPGAQAGLGEVIEEAAGPLAAGQVAARFSLWVGPEGGWQPGETESLSHSGVRLARLGQSILRTETAGPVAVAITRLALGDW